MERNEKELARLACEGNREAYWRLVEPHLRVVLSAARAVLMNSADAVVESSAQDLPVSPRSKVQHIAGADYHQ